MDKVDHVMTPQTPAQRVAASKARKRAAGLVEVRSLWAHPDDVDAIRQHARDLAAKRAARKAAG